MSEDTSTSPAGNTPPLDEYVQNQENDEQENPYIKKEAVFKEISGFYCFTDKMRKFLDGFYSQLDYGQELARDLFSQIGPDGYQINLTQNRESIKSNLRGQFREWKGEVDRMPNWVFTEIVGEIMRWKKKNPKATKINLNTLRIQIKNAIHKQLESDRIDKMSLRDLPGIEKATAARLEQHDITKVAELIDEYNQAPDQFQLFMSYTVGQHENYARLTTQALGLYTRIVTRQQPPVSIYQPLVDVVVTACKERQINSANLKQLERQIKTLIEKFVPED